MKKIWICGANGMLGSHFKRLLTKLNIPHITTSHSQLDIGDNLDLISDIIRIEKITHVINCAAYTAVDLAESEQKKAYQANAVAPHNLAIAGRRHGAWVGHFSTDYVFSGDSRFPYVEDDILSPLNLYGMSKMIGEIKLLEEHQRSCVIRTSWLFGYPGKNFVNRMLNVFENNEEVQVISNQVSCPTFCEDLAEATLDLLDEEGIFHFANAGEASRYEFAEEIYRQAEKLKFPLKTKIIKPIHASEHPTVAKRPLYSVLNTTKIEKTLGKEIRPWKQALSDYLTHLKAEKDSLAVL